MKALIRAVAVVLIGAAAAAPSRAALEKYKDWDKGPEFLYFATDEERAAWKKASSDAEAERLVALFWARRDPDLKTPRNEFKDRLEALVKLADERFGLRGRRGALTERGRVLIVIGSPKQIVTRDRTPAASPDEPAAAGRIVEYTFVYEDDRLPPWAGQKKLEIAVDVDQGRGTETFANLSQFAALEKTAVRAAILHPELTAPPAYPTREEVEAAQKAASAAVSEASRGPALSPAARSVLEALSPAAAGPLAVMPIGTRDGSTRLMVQVDLPATSVGSKEGAKLAVLVRDKDGKDAARLEEAAVLDSWKGELFTARSLAVLPGDYDIAAALLDAPGGVLAAGRKAAAVPPVPAGFGASPLLVARADVEGARMKPDDPFVFSGRLFLSAPGGTFSTKDGLSYALRVYNPAVDPATKTAFLRRSLRIKPKGSATIQVPSGEDKPTPVPDLKGAGALVIDLAGSVLDENIGDYFRPGDYELRMTVTDEVSGKSLEASAPFKVEGPSKPSAPAAPNP
ncbi:MAG: GWxTD domain-containing protein [Acidithiobacillales bacterium]